MSPRGVMEGEQGLEEQKESVGREHVIGEIVGLSEPIYRYMLVAHSDAWARVSLTMPQFKVLVAAAMHGRIDSPYLGRRLGMLPSTLTRIVDRLVERDLVRRRVDPRDRRVVYLEATEDGQRLVRDLTANTFPPAMTQALKNISQEELGTLREGARILAQAIERIQGQPTER